MGILKKVLLSVFQKKLNNLFDHFIVTNQLSKDKKWIGLAPFSKHKQKNWPLTKIASLLAALKKDGGYKIFLLGGADEASSLEDLSSHDSEIINMAGILSLSEEIAMVHELDLVVAMDSFNMHLAALCNTKVISIWGGTHPYAGFGPLNNNTRYIVQVPPSELECRPCSVFGNTPCHRGDWACLTRIDVNDVLKMIQ